MAAKDVRRSVESSFVDNRFCNLCEKSFNTTKGLKIHNGRVHKVSNSKPYVNDSTLAQTSDSFLVSDRTENGASNLSFHDKLSSLKRSNHIMKRIPKSARICSASALCEIIDVCLHSNSSDSWENLLTFAYNLFTIPLTKETRKVSLTSLIKKNIKNLNSSSVIPPQISNRKYNQDFSKLVLSKIADGDIRSAVRILSSSDTLAEYDDTILSVLRSKHPKSDSLINSPDKQLPTDFSNYAVFQFSDNEVLEAINSFNSSSAGGLDSFRPSHMQDLISHSAGNSGQKLLSSVTKLCNFILTGKVSPDICPILFGASLCALRKKDGGVRPIAVGTFYRRLVAKLCCMKIKDELGSMLRPIQFGFGTPGGCEAVAHAARRYINLHPNPEKKILLKLDFKNAFNMIDRNIMLHKVEDSFPGLFPFLSQCYNSPSYLSFGENLILSERGVQQGDPLGPALFCLTIDELTKSISSEFNCWYLDDGSIAGNEDIVSKDFEKIISYSRLLGLELNFAKCELITLSSSEEVSDSKILKLAPSVKILDKTEWSLLGAPLSKNALSEHLQAKRESFELLTSRLDKLPKHVAFFLLKNCLAIPKLMYTLRCSPTWTSQSELDEFDNLLRHTMESVTNNDFNDESWLQATLPVNLGGLGLRSASSLALPTFLSSVNSVSDLINSILPPVFNGIKDNFYAEGETLWHSLTDMDPPTVYASSQKVWDRPLLNIISDKLLLSTNVYEKARLKAAMVKESGAWLNALPVASLGTLLDDESFRIAVGLRLGSAICVPHICICGSKVDEKGGHGLSCRRSAGRLSRHYQVNDILKRAMVSAGIPAILEPSGTSRDDGKRPDGMSLIPWKLGKPVVWDFTCVDTVAASHLSESSKSAGSAAISGEKLKRRKYQNLGSNYLFYPVAVETFGVYGPESLSFIHELGRRLGQATKDRRATTFLLERISIAIQRGNAASVFGTIPPSHCLDEILYIPHFSKKAKSLSMKQNSGQSKSSMYVEPLIVDPLSFSEKSKINNRSSSNQNSSFFSNCSSQPLQARAELIPLEDSTSLGRINCSVQNGLVEDVAVNVIPFKSSDSSTNHLNNHGSRIGLNNLGNTCYINSVLQALFMTESFRNDLLTNNNDISQLFSELKQMFKQLEFSERVSSFSPYDFIKSLGPTRFSSGQQDSSEFLVYLLSTLREQENESINLLQRPESQLTSSSVQKAFGGKLLTVLRCSRCRVNIRNFSDFFELELAFPNLSEIQSVQNLIIHHLRTEHLTGHNQLHCRICAKTTDSHKITSIVEAPENLILTLKLFSYDSTSHKSIKLFQRIKLEEQPCLADCRYELYAVIVHCGSGVDSGHYYTLAKDRTDWYKFDDSCVIRTSSFELDFLEPLETPYILFYRRADINNSTDLFRSFHSINSNYSDDVVLQVFPGFPAAVKANAPPTPIKPPRSAD